MKRVLLVLFVLGGLAAVGVGGAYWWVNHQHQLVIDSQKKILTDDPVKKGTALKYEQLQELEAKGDAAATEIPNILACFDVEDEDLRLQAALTLSKIGKQAVQPVRQRLGDPNPKVRLYAVWTLSWLGPTAAEAADDVRTRLNDPDPEVRRKAADALGRLGVANASVINSLLSTLIDADESVSEAAGESLEKIGRPATAMLYGMLANKSEPRRGHILSVLVKLGPPPKETLPLLIELAGNPSEIVRDQEIRQLAITLLGQAGEPSVPTFRELIQKQNPQDQEVLVRAIATLGPMASPLIPELVPGLEKMVREAEELDPEVIDIFKKCGAAGAKGLADVLKKVKREEEDSRYKVLVKTIGDIGPEAKVAVPVLIEVLKSDEPGDKALRPQVLEAIGDIGPAAREAVPAVQALSKEAGLEEAVRSTLRRLGEIVKAPTPE